jgi:ribulose-5-phosphate 4-epimerase/fuculose-1-phosphate aldolase
MNPEATTEHELRQQPAAGCRVVALLGWTELIHNHITLCVPGPERHFLINPFALNRP